MLISETVATRTVATIPATPRPGALAFRALEYWLRFYRRTWRSSLVSGFLAPLLYLGSLGFGLGTLVHRQVAGVPYVVFVAPGVLAATAMQTSVTEATYPVMAAIKWQRQYHAMLAGPLGVLDVMFGHLLYILFRTTVVTGAFLLTGYLLGAFRSGWVLLALPVAVLCGAAHAPSVMAFSAAQDSDSGFTLLFRFGLIPMFLFAGTFFPISQLPSGLRVLAWCTPLWHATQLTRGLALSRIGLLAATGHVAYLALWTVVGIRLAAGSFTRRLSL